MENTEENTEKYALFFRIFEKRLSLNAETILKIAGDVELTVLDSDIKKDMRFLWSFSNSYPIEKTTTEQFSLLLIFFAIRQTRGMKDSDSQYMDHFRSINLNLKLNHKLSPTQIDFWKWINL